jgi:hypothetical protein
MLEFWMSDQERMALAGCLRRLAQTPEALRMLEIPKVRSRAGRPAVNGARNDLAALDYEETKERLKITKMGKADVAKAEVCEAWGMARSVLMDAVKKSKASEHWKAWARITRAEFAINHPHLKPAARLAEISKTLRGQII